jgi:peptide/nickel transport system substrate-binding protein
MVLTRNPYYWAMGEDGKPLPYLDEIDFKVVPDDATRILQLESGALDGAEFIPYARVQELSSKPDLNMKLFLSTRIEYVLTNNHDMVLGEKNPLANLDVRHALGYATNTKALIQIVTHGVGSEMTSFMSKGTPYHSGDKPLFSYDLAKAKALLVKAGYPHGFETTMLVLAGNQDELSIATILQQMWSQVGVTLKLQQVDSATRTAAYHAEKYDMRLSLWTDDIADPSEITSYFAYSPTTDSQHSGWKNDTVNTLFEASQSELDPVKRRADYAEIQKIYNETGPILPLYETPYPVALRKDVHGFNQIPLGNNIFRGAWVSKPASN